MWRGKYGKTSRKIQKCEKEKLEIHVSWKYKELFRPSKNLKD